MQHKLLIIVLFICAMTDSFAQSSDSITIFQQKTLTGYFVCIRDSIPETDPDVTLSRYDFRIFFFQNLDDSLIQSFNSLKLFTPGYTLISGGVNYDIADSKIHKQYVNYLIKNNIFEKADRYKIFDFDQIDHNVIESKKPLASIFKGKLNVVGPFLPFIHLADLAKQDLYMYLPTNDNDIHYFCTIIY